MIAAAAQRWGAKGCIQRAVMGAGLAMGIWQFVVRPMEGGVAKARAALASDEGACADAAIVADAEGDLDARANELEVRVRALRAWVDQSGDSGRLYEQFRSLASGAGVRIDRIEPGVPRAAGRASPGEPVVETFTCSVELSGEFDRIVKFVDSVERGMGAAKVTNLRLAPMASASGGGVAVTLETTHLKLGKAPASPSQRPVLKMQSMGGRP